MPSFLSRPKSHVRRPRSGQFDAQKLKQYLNENQQQETRDSKELELEAEARRSPAALIMDTSGAGSSNSSSSNSSSSLSMRTADHGQQLPQRHTRVVSVSWPGETRHTEMEPQQPLHWQELQNPDSVTSITSPRAVEDRGEARKQAEAGFVPVGGGAEVPARAASAAAATEAASAAAAAVAAAAAAAAAPSKRQRQTDWANTKASSGPIDIPLSPGDQRRGQPSTFHPNSLLGYRSMLATGEEGGASDRGGRAATDAGAWYPCWPRTRPGEDSSGDGNGPPAHILIWERSYMRSASLQQQAMALEEPLGAGLGNRRVSEGSAGGIRGEVQGEEEDEEDDDDEGDVDRLDAETSMFEMDF